LASMVVGGTERPVVLVDWTETGRDFCALTAAVPIGGRALPIYSEVHPLKLLSNGKIEARFLKKLHDHVLPSPARPIVVTDAGFPNPWFRAVRRLGWDFIGRLSAGVLLNDDSANEKAKHKRGPWTSAKSLFVKATPTAKDLGLKTITKSNPLNARVLIVRKRNKGRKGSKRVTRKGVHPGSTVYKKYQRRGREPWLLATSLTAEAATWVVGRYSLRMQIEETFRDAKNHRFGWSF
jgi:hypothetical protein